MIESMSATVTRQELAAWVDRLTDVDTAAADGELIDQITELEKIKSACAAAQAALTLAFHTSRTRGLTSTELRDEGTHRSINTQIALARRDSPYRGGRHVGLAKALIREMPHTYTALRTGQISEWRATLLTRETACLTAADRGTVDTELADRLPTMGDQHTAAAAAHIAQRLDPANCAKRHRKAATERRVSIRPAPDTMTYLTALLPVAHGVAVYAALTRHADTTYDDPRSRSQLMADELVHRITQFPARANTADSDPAGSAGSGDAAGGADPTDCAGPGDCAGRADGAGSGDAAGPAGSGDSGTVPTGTSIDIHLVMTDRTLLDTDAEPAHLTGYGPIPAPLARRIISGADPTTKIFIQRLYSNPRTGHLHTADTTRRTFPPAARNYLISRDQTCRTPWCDAPIRHADHITAHQHGGPTSITNGQGLCVNCNHTKQAPGWHHQPPPDNDTTITITTPTGHTHHSRPPRPPHSPPWENPRTYHADLTHYLASA